MTLKALCQEPSTREKYTKNPPESMKLEDGSSLIGSGVIDY